jgi:FMN reductase
VRVTVLVGNPKAQSRTLRVASRVADLVEQRLSATRQPSRLTIDLADIGPELFDWASRHVTGLVDDVIASDLLVVASPTYKATYTGLLKLFLDRIPAPALQPVVAVPVMIGGSPIHSLAPEVHLRPVLIELGASCPTKGLFVLETQFDELHGVIDAWLDDAERSLRRALMPNPRSA